MRNLNKQIVEIRMLLYFKIKVINSFRVVIHFVLLKLIIRLCTFEHYFCYYQK